MRQWVPTRCQRTNLQVEPCGVAGWPHQGLLLGACGLTALSKRSKSRPEYWGGFQVSAPMPNLVLGKLHPSSG